MNFTVYYKLIVVNCTVTGEQAHRAQHKVNLKIIAIYCKNDRLHFRGKCISNRLKSVCFSIFWSFFGSWMLVVCLLVIWFDGCSFCIFSEYIFFWFFIHRKKLTIAFFSILRVMFFRWGKASMKSPLPTFLISSQRCLISG